MKMPPGRNEQEYFDALKRITRYQTVEQLRRTSERQYGLEFVEALGMAYENVIQEARDATKGKRNPSQSTARGESQTSKPGVSKPAMEPPDDSAIKHEGEQ